MNPRAIVLLSGGMDSATTAAIAKEAGFAVYALSFRYGQRHDVELAAAERIAKALGVAEHKIVNVDLGSVGGSALTANIDVPKDRAQIGGDVPVTYVPARNALFLSFGLAWAEVIGAHDVFIGVSQVDSSGYPDCRPEFLTAFEQIARLGTKSGASGEKWQIRAPLISMTKADIVRTGVKLGVDFSLTHSCYDPKNELACGHCDACLLRKRGFVDAKVEDPTRYA